MKSIGAWTCEKMEKEVANEAHWRQQLRENGKEGHQ